MDKIMAMAERYSLSVIEDCAHSFPAYFRKDENSPWIQTGMWGDVGCFSFYANKCITTGEGGMAVTNDETLARRMSLMSLHGMNNDAWKRYTSQGSWYYEIVAPGFKYNLSDIAASIGLHQLNRANEFLNQRTRVAQKYTESFKGNSFIQAPPEAPETRKHSWHLYSIRLNLEKLTIDRAEFIRRLKEKGISCSVHWMPLHLHPYYRDAFCLKAGFFPCAEKEWPRLISLPIFPSLQEKEIEYVVEAIDEISNKYEKR
jgi:perosamine synthetase